MPIVDVQLVCEPPDSPNTALTQSLADALGKVFDSPPGRTWVRVHSLGSEYYAENGTSVAGRELPVFVTVLQAHPPESLALEAEVRAVTAAVAACLEWPEEHVHVQYAPAAAGRQAFGGKLVR